MIQKLLIANRGEIACRVITTAHRMGIATVAVFSQADRNAAHVAMAHEAVCIGPAPVAQSYLKGEAIIAAALATGATAIHPGYGFLSENPAFVEAVEAAGLIFVGPPASAIRAMGLKDAAKAAMETAGVPVVPGYHGANQDAAILSQEAARIGYPVMIKARAGGGGKGMRMVEAPGDFSAALQSAQREGAASFGDASVLVEKYVSAPRHVEIQIFADAHGHVVHLFERDCSLQRRHQKVIEEAPAPGMSEEVRRAMGQAAVEAARAIGYRGAGTVEFIADGSSGLRTDGFWFMEMNTRLQVEHPVSEAITGLDFVELQLRVAAGEPLPFAQADLAIQGHAFEARLYAEDVPKGFLPATGRLDHFVFPQGASAFERGAVRIDSGVRAGDDITPWYDPMIAKVIVHGPDRASALASLAATLDAIEVGGTVTNIGFLSRLARHEGFAAGRVDTGLIGRDIDTLAHPGEPGRDAALLAGLALEGLLDPPGGSDPWDRLRGFRPWGTASFAVSLRQDERRIEIAARIAGSVFGLDDGRTIEARREGDRVILEENGARRSYRIVVRGRTATVFEPGVGTVYSALDPLDRGGASSDRGDTVLAPMPGLVTRLFASAGAIVAAGDPIAILEAMKMEHTLTAPRSGTLAEVLVTQGAQVRAGDIVATLEEDVLDEGSEALA